MKHDKSTGVKGVFRKKLTLTGWMHNRNALIAVSLLIAVVLWAVVMNQSTDLTTRTITVPVTVDLNGSYASTINLRLTDEITKEVKVEVKGPWSTISSLTAEDVRVRADVSTVQKAGKQKVTLVPSRNSDIVNYEIVSCSPSQLEVQCDYWNSDMFPLEVDASSLKVDDPNSMRLGLPVPDAVTNGKLTVSGPQTTINRIDKLVAPLVAENTLKETTNFSPELKALDKKGNEVDLKNCTIEELEDKPLTVTVPVDFYKEITLAVEWHNAPAAVKNNKDLFSLSPKTITVVGPQDVLATLSDTLVVTTVDFDHMTGRKYEEKAELLLPDAVTVQGEVTEASWQLDLTKYKKKEVPLTVSNATVSFANNTAKKKTTVEAQKYNITVYGTEEALKNLDAKGLKVTADLAGAKENGSAAVQGVVNLPDGFNGWIWYGKDSTAIPVNVKLS